MKERGTGNKTTTEQQLLARLGLNHAHANFRLNHARLNRHESKQILA